MRLYEKMPSLEGATEALNGNVHQVIRTEIPVLIHFWAASCSLCKKAMVNINMYRDQYEDNLQVISVHMPRKEEDYILDRIREDVEKYRIEQVTLIDNNGTIKDAFQNKYVPSYYLFDKKGELRYMQTGGNGRGMMEKRLLRLLNETES